MANDAWLAPTGGWIEVISGVMFNTGDEIRIEGVPDGRETAALDYVEIHAAGN